jgi:hypothetical protein
MYINDQLFSLVIAQSINNKYILFNDSNKQHVHNFNSMLSMGDNSPFYKLKSVVKGR